MQCMACTPCALHANARSAHVQHTQALHAPIHTIQQPLEDACGAHKTCLKSVSNAPALL